MENMERREFIGTGTAGVAAGAALLGGALAARAQETPSEDDVNVALIGCGSQGRVLLNSMLKIPGVKFKAVCDIWPYRQTYASRYLGKFGHKVEVYSDYRELLEKEKDIDAVVCASPDVFHAPITVAALEAGKAVYCEKNMSNTIEGAREMVKAMKSTGKLCQIGHQRRSNPRYLHAMKLHQEENIFGRLMFANAQWNRGVSEPNTIKEKYHMPVEDLKKWGFNSMHELLNWRWFKKHGGGPICDLGAHQIDILNWFFGSNPVSVFASGGKDFYEEYEWEDNAMAIYEYNTDKGMARAFYQVLTTTSSLGFLERFMGTEATLAISEIPRWNHLYREVTAPDWDGLKAKGLLAKEGDEGPEAADTSVDVRMSPAPEKWDIPVSNEKPLHMYHLENFFSAVRDGTPLNCPADVAFPTAVTVLKVNEAIAAKKRLELNEEDFTV